LNLDPTTEVGKFFWIDPEIKNRLINDYDYNGLFAASKNEDAESDITDAGTNDIALSLVDSLHSQNWSRIGEKFFKLPSTEQLIEKLKNNKK